MTDFSTNPMTGASLSARTARWWKAQTSDHQRKKFLQGALGVACFGAFVMAMPILSGVNAQQQSEEQFRDRSQMLADIRQDDLQVTVALDGTSELLGHKWLQSVETSLERDTSSALSRYAAYDRDQAAISSLIDLEVPKRTDAEALLAERQCLATAIYYEARSESAAGQIGVAEVILNRVGDHRYPNTICDVVYQGATRTTGCQFTFTCDGAMAKKPRGAKWTKAQTVASHVMMGLNEGETKGATHYHATYVDPVWNSGLIKTKKIGTHIFYRFPRGSEWTVASARQSARLAKRRSGLKAIAPASAPAVAETAVLKSAPAADVQDKELTVADLNAQALEAMKTEASVGSPVATDVAAQPVVTRRVVRRIVNGEVVEETEVPVTTASASASTLPTSVNSAY